MKSAFAWAVLACSAPTVSLQAAQDTPAPEQLAIVRASEPIAVDGRLDEATWKTALRVDTWYETNPGDSVPAKVKNVGYLAYDDKYLYAGFEFEDPQPGSIRAPFADRDNVGSDTDYGGLVLNPRNDGRTGLLLLANPRGIQYDAINDDATGSDDNAPDFFWDSAARIGEKGWTLELRVPFSSLRYPQTRAQLEFRRLGALRLQAQLADRAVPGLRRRARAERSERSPRAAEPAAVPQALVRAYAFQR